MPKKRAAKKGLSFANNTIPGPHTILRRAVKRKRKHAKQ